MAEGLVNFTRVDDAAEVVAISQGRPMSPWDEVRVVDEPSIPHPDDPQFPKPLVNFVLGLVLAFTGGGAIAAAQAAARLTLSESSSA